MGKALYAAVVGSTDGQPAQGGAGGAAMRPASMERWQMAHTRQMMSALWKQLGCHFALVSHSAGTATCTATTAPYHSHASDSPRARRATRRAADSLGPGDTQTAIHRRARFDLLGFKNLTW